MANPLEDENILDKKVARGTKGKDYFEYLIKWKDKPVKYSTSLSVIELRKKGHSVEDLMSRRS